VADGVGGHAAGEIASATIIEALAPLGDSQAAELAAGLVELAATRSGTARRRRLAAS